MSATPMLAPGRRPVQALEAHADCFARLWGERRVTALRLQATSRGAAVTCSRRTRVAGPMCDRAMSL
jgi:hypothetical protein